MKYIFKYIFIVLLCIVLIDRVFSFLFMQFVFPKALSGESGGTINYVIEKKKDLDFLILGASRAKHGIDPILLTSLGSRGYNLGINGTNVVNQYLILDILLSKNVHPNTIVLQTDLFTYDKMYDSKESVLDQIKRVYPYNTPSIKRYVKDIGIKEQILYFFDTYKLNRKIINIAYNALKTSKLKDTNGFVGLPVLSFLDNNEPLFPNHTYLSTSTNGIALKKIQQLITKNNIKLILVLVPSYNNVLYNKKEQLKMLADLKNNGFLNIIDLSDITKVPVLNNPLYWRDSTHLSESGAKIFSTLLNKEFEKQKFNSKK